jgi:hypothetical protein
MKIEMEESGMNGQIRQQEMIRWDWGTRVVARRQKMGETRSPEGSTTFSFIVLYMLENNYV